MGNREFAGSDSRRHRSDRDRTASQGDSAVSSGGFDCEALLEQIQDKAVKEKLVDNTGNAVARGAFGIPTFYIGEEMFFGKERIGQMEEMLAGMKGP